MVAYDSQAQAPLATNLASVSAGQDTGSIRRPGRGAPVNDVYVDAGGLIYLVDRFDGHLEILALEL